MTSVLDGTETVIAAKATDRDDLYRIEVDDEVVGFAELDPAGHWQAKSMGQIEGQPLDARGAENLDLAAREAAEHFTGRSLR